MDTCSGLLIPDAPHPWVSSAHTQGPFTGARAATRIIASVALIRQPLIPSGLLPTPYANPTDDQTDVATRPWPRSPTVSAPFDQSGPRAFLGRRRLAHEPQGHLQRLLCGAPSPRASQSLPISGPSPSGPPPVRTQRRAHERLRRGAQINSNCGRRGIRGNYKLSALPSWQTLQWYALRGLVERVGCGA